MHSASAADQMRSRVDVQPGTRRCTVLPIADPLALEKSAGDKDGAVSCASAEWPELHAAPQPRAQMVCVAVYLGDEGCGGACVVTVVTSLRQ
jgi:hypothetical protein